jgi:voltage-gated potassium channel
MRTIDGHSLGAALLFLSVVITVFVVATLPVQYHVLLYRVFFSIMLVACVLSLASRHVLTIVLALGVVALQWLPSRHHEIVQGHVARVLTMFFFAFIVSRLIIQIARARVVTLHVILAPVNGYLLLGIVFGLLVATLMADAPWAFELPPAPPGSPPRQYRIGDHLYYAFMTLTTVGYGDMLPRAPSAKSLAILIAVTGQLYVAVIIATLVGKYVSTSAPGGK